MCAADIGLWLSAAVFFAPLFTCVLIPWIKIYVKAWASKANYYSLHISPTIELGKRLLSCPASIPAGGNISGWLNGVKKVVQTQKHIHIVYVAAVIFGARGLIGLTCQSARCCKWTAPFIFSYLISPLTRKCVYNGLRVIPEQRQQKNTDGARFLCLFVLIRPSIMRANNSIDSARWIPLGWYDFTQSASSRTGRKFIPHAAFLCVPPFARRTK